ncbi:MAG: UDP-2,3-diacylglucosamine diphosphatase [Chloroflexi bacterium]|nr:UDP-2,3-diacylglucosamine diphosphatase [Chloroflexota bacterium]
MNAAKRDYRAVFISDTHLGFERARVDALAHFLASHHSDHLYLVGDIVDVWRMRRKVYWPQAHSAIIEGLLERSGNGTQVHYIVGNHDEMLRASGTSLLRP